MCDCEFPQEYSYQRQTASFDLAGYNRWRMMVRRCYDPQDKAFEDYGGRGIKICLQWLSDFKNYVIDTGKAPGGMTLDRTENNKSYCPHNFKWATRTEQSLNRRDFKRKEKLPRGVYQNKYTFFSQIKIAEKTYYIRARDTVEECSSDYEKVYMEWYGKLP